MHENERRMCEGYMRRRTLTNFFGALGLSFSVKILSKSIFSTEILVFLRRKLFGVGGRVSVLLAVCFPRKRWDGGCWAAGKRRCVPLWFDWIPASSDIHWAVSLRSWWWLWLLPLGWNTRLVLWFSRFPSLSTCFSGVPPRRMSSRVIGWLRLFSPSVPECRFRKWRAPSATCRGKRRFPIDHDTTRGLASCRDRGMNRQGVCLLLSLQGCMLWCRHLYTWFLIRRCRGFSSALRNKMRKEWKVKREEWKEASPPTPGPLQLPWEGRDGARGVVSGI